MKLTEIASGSSGNCSYLFLEENKLILFDLGISFKQLKEHLDFTKSMSLLILITHAHTDHWNLATYKQLEKLETLDILLISPLKRKRSFLWKSYSIDSFPLKHGDTFSCFYVVDRLYGYATDINSNSFAEILLFDEAYELDELFIEANYDARFLKSATSLSILQGYDLQSSFSRHLSIQESEYIQQCLNPKKVKTIHHSSRFYEYEGENCSETCD